jgi:hypothetical protein
MKKNQTEFKMEAVNYSIIDEKMEMLKQSKTPLPNEYFVFSQLLTKNYWQNILK